MYLRALQSDWPKACHSGLGNDVGGSEHRAEHVRVEMCHEKARPESRVSVPPPGCVRRAWSFFPPGMHSLGSRSRLMRSKVFTSADATPQKRSCDCSVVRLVAGLLRRNTFGLPPLDTRTQVPDLACYGSRRPPATAPSASGPSYLYELGSRVEPFPAMHNHLPQPRSAQAEPVWEPSACFERLPCYLPRPFGGRTKGTPYLAR